MPEFLNVIRSSETPHTVRQHFTDEPSSGFPLTQLTNQTLVDTNVDEFENSKAPSSASGRVSMTGDFIRTRTPSIIEISSDDELEDIKGNDSNTVILNVETRKLPASEDYANMTGHGPQPEQDINLSAVYQRRRSFDLDVETVQLQEHIKGIQF
jgi:hypothetical protein